MEDNNNLNLMSLYLSDIQKFDLLSKEEEYDLLRRIKEENDEQARQLLILSNLNCCCLPFHTPDFFFKFFNLKILILNLYS